MEHDNDAREPKSILQYILLAHLGFFFLCPLQSSSPDRPDNNSTGELPGAHVLIIHPHMNLVITVKDVWL